MKRRVALTAWASTLTRLAVGAVPARLLPTVEWASMLAQGKGSFIDSVPQEVAAVIRLLPAQKRVSPLVIDVGANIGAWSREFLERIPSAHVIAIEPSSEALPQLIRNLSEWQQVTIVAAAAGACEGSATLFSEKPGSKLSSLWPRDISHWDLDHGAFSETIDVVSLDSLCAKAMVSPDVLKIDAEGNELEVLRGSEALLEELSVVQFEVGPASIGSRVFFQDFWRFLKDRNFDVWRLTPRGLRPIFRYTEQDEVFLTTNYFACPSKRRG
jgi:FkbM family methyltransferase